MVEKRVVEEALPTAPEAAGAGEAIGDGTFCVVEEFPSIVSVCCANTEQEANNRAEPKKQGM